MKALPPREKYLLELILLLAVVLRLWGISFGLPDLFHADEPIVVNHAMAYGATGFHPHFFRIPPLASYLLFFFYGIFFLLGWASGFLPSLQAFEHLFYRDPTAFYLIGRGLLGALPGTLTVLVVFFLVNRYNLRGKALLSAFFMAVCYLHVKESHYIYADIPLVLVLTLAWIPLWNLDVRPYFTWNHILAGILTGMAAALKYNGGVLVLPYLLFALKDVRKGLRFLKHLAFFFGFSLVTYLALNPYSFWDWPFFLEEIRREALAHRGGTPPFNHLLFTLPESMGWPLFFFSLTGIFKAFRERSFKRSAMAFFVVMYYLILWNAGQNYERYVLPMMPFLMILAADALWDILQRFQIRKMRTVILLAMLAALPSLGRSVFWDQIMTRKDTRTLAKEWIETHVPAGSRIALEGDFFMPRLRFTSEQLLEKRAEVLVREGAGSPKLRKLNYRITSAPEAGRTFHLAFIVRDQMESDRFLYGKPILAYDWSALRKQKFDYVVLTRRDGSIKARRFYDSLLRESELAARLTPYQDPSRSTGADTLAMTGGPFSLADLILRERNGLVIEIYKVRAEEEAGSGAAGPVASSGPVLI